MSPWDSLSVEIYDEIFSYIAVPVNHDELDSGTRKPMYDDIHEFDFICGVAHSNYGYRFRRGDTNLRLVSKAFDRAMTRAYFKNEPARFRAYQTSATRKLQEFIIDEGAIMASQITRLEIELMDESRTNLHESQTPELSLKSFVSNLEEAFSRLPKLASLVVDVNKDVRSDGPVYVDSDHSDDEEDHGPVLDLDLLDSIRSNIARLFSSPRIELRMVTYLRLTLFSAYDLATIGTHISDDMAMQLRHLYLEYTDGTGPGGDLEYTRHWQGDGDVGDEDMPFSNLQRRFPNHDHMGGICNMISRCRKLKSLGLAGTQCIDLRSLNWQPHSTGLENITISRAIVTMATLVALVSPSTSSPTPTSKVAAFAINDVQLWDKTWGDVFDHLLTSSSLQYLYVYNVIYHRDGKSRDLRMWNNRPSENVSVLWSERKEDERTLGKLIRTVEGRGGRSAIDMDDLDTGSDGDEE